MPISGEGISDYRKAKSAKQLKRKQVRSTCPKIGILLINILMVSIPVLNYSKYLIAHTAK